MIERDRNPDHGWAWMISISCGIINALTFGLIRSFGVFFYHLRDEFELSRETASWPFALCTSATYLSGPLTGFLLSYFPLKKIVLVGVILASFGFLVSSFSENIFFTNLGVGFIYGFGVGFSFMQTPVILAQYFNKYLATANSISQAGGTVGSFIFTPLLEYMISNYGLRGAFLLTSAILLNGIPCGLLLRPPNPSTESDNQATESTTNQQDVPKSHKEPQYHLMTQHKMKEFCMRKNSLDTFRALDHKSKKQKRMIDRYLSDTQTLLLKELLSNEKMLTLQKQIRYMNKLFEETKSLLINTYHESDHPASIEQPSSFNYEKYFVIEHKLSECRTTFQNRYVQTLPFNKPKIWFDSIKFIVGNPMYLILLTTHVSFQWTWMTYQMIIYDFAIDQNLTNSQSVSLLTCFALSDLFGRFLSGWISDRNLMKKNHIVSICILCISFIIQITSYFVSYSAQLFLANLLGFFCGVIIVLFNILSMEYVGLDHFPDALGLSAFFVGITSLARPYIIGIFRDVFGSYSGLFQFAGLLSFLSALLWLMEPFAILNFRRAETQQRMFEIQAQK